ncbi:MAG: hypothetical protein HY074_18845 [Deltaproteobacteria bacterium]|nr:hypothetical protein [Deltaproteobacteria bacterium]
MESAHGADWFISALIFGAGLSVLTLGSALGFSLFTKAIHPEGYKTMNQRIGRILMYLTTSALATSLFSSVITGLTHLISPASKAPVAMFTETPLVSVLLGLATSPFFTRRLSHVIRSWTLLAVVLTFSFTITVLMLYT